MQTFNGKVSTLRTHWGLQISAFHSEKQQQQQQQQQKGGRDHRGMEGGGRIILKSVLNCAVE
jgi:hypothetical protein